MMPLAIKLLSQNDNSSQFTYFGGFFKRGFITVNHPQSSEINDPSLWAEMRAIQYLMEEHNLFDRGPHYTGSGTYIMCSSKLVDEVNILLANLQTKNSPSLNISNFSTYLYFYHRFKWLTLGDPTDIDIQWPSLTSAANPKLYVYNRYIPRLPETFCPVLGENIYVSRHAVEQLVAKTTESTDYRPLQLATASNKHPVWYILDWLQNPKLVVQKLSSHHRFRKLVNYGSLPIVVSVPSSSFSLTTELDKNNRRYVVTAHLIKKSELSTHVFYTPEETQARLYLQDMNPISA